MNKETELSLLLNQLFTILDKKNVSYCVCGNYLELPYRTENDVDIWTNDHRVVCKIIEEICKLLHYKIYLKNTNATGTNLFIFTNNSELCSLIHIDILKSCNWYGILPLVRSDVIKSHRKRYRNFYIADEIIDSAMHLMYPLSHFGQITEKYHEDIKKAATTSSFWKIVKDGWGESFCSKIKPIIKKADWSTLENEFLNNKQKLLWNSIRNIKKSDFFSFFSFSFYNFQRLLKPAGLFIAFIGPDGCGKTTAQKNLEPFFKKSFTKGKIKKFYWRPFLFPEIKKLFGLKKSERAEIEVPADRLKLRNANPAQKIFHCIKLLYYWADSIMGPFKYQGVWSRGGVVCFDRYWDDLIVFPERFGLNVPKWLVQGLSFFVPKPDIIFYLDVDPTVLTERKLELPIDEITAQVTHYRKLSLLNNNYEQINGNQSKDEVLKNITHVCLEKMAKRHN